MPKASPKATRTDGDVLTTTTFSRISNGLAHRLSLVPLGDAVHRADIGALTAVDADGFVSGLFQRIGTMHSHFLRAHFFAHTATDTFVLPTLNAGIVRLNGYAH